MNGKNVQLQIETEICFDKKRKKKKRKSYEKENKAYRYLFTYIRVYCIGIR